MEKSFTENLNAKGHLTISKVANGQEELIYDDKNVIVSGFGFGLSFLYSKLGSNVITDYQIDRFQLGVSGQSANQVSSTYQLSGSLTSIDEYISDGADTDLLSFPAYQIKGTSVITTPSYFAKIPFSKVTRIDSRSVRYTILVDEEACNSLKRNVTTDAYLSEIGLFMKNPLGSNPEASILVAYRSFTPIRKTSDFALLFRWTITFG